MKGVIGAIIAVIICWFIGALIGAVVIDLCQQYNTFIRNIFVSLNVADLSFGNYFWGVFFSGCVASALGLGSKVTRKTN